MSPGVSSSARRVTGTVFSGGNERVRLSLGMAAAQRSLSIYLNENHVHVY